MSEILLSLEKINKSFGGVRVLKDVSFYLKRGTVHALVGGNGAGKSTLMKIMSGIYTLDSGEIKINGELKKIHNYHEAGANGIRMIFQEMSLIPTETIMENIFLNHEIKKGIHLNKKEMSIQAAELLHNLGIDVDVDTRIEDLGVGICQLVEIAKAISVNSSILVMDEPTASLTEHEIEVLFRIIENLKQRGVGIIYISHKMKEIFQIADEVSVLRDGSIVTSRETCEFNMRTLIDQIIGTNNEKAMEWRERETAVSNDTILKVDNLSFGNKLKNATFELKGGEVLGLAGLMGSGRTEILELLAGVAKPTSGSIVLNEKNVTFKNVQSAIDKGIVLIPEDRRREGLVLMHSMKDNLILPNLKVVTKNGKISRAITASLVKSAISELMIKVDDVDSEIIRLSGGNQQKVVIAKWLKTNPKILLMDEPTAGVDIGAKVEIIEIIRKFASSGGSVILVSSELSELIAVCDRILVIRQGQIIGELLHSEIRNEEALQYAVQN